MHADAQDDLVLRRDAVLRCRHPRLDRRCAGDCGDNGAELDDDAVTHQLNDAAAVFGEERLQDFLPNEFEAGERPGLVGLDQARVTDYIGDRIAASRRSAIDTIRPTSAIRGSSRYSVAGRYGFLPTAAIPLGAFVGCPTKMFADCEMSVFGGQSLPHSIAVGGIYGREPRFKDVLRGNRKARIGSKVRVRDGPNRTRSSRRTVWTING